MTLLQLPVRRNTLTSEGVPACCCCSGGRGPNPCSPRGARIRRRCRLTRLCGRKASCWAVLGNCPASASAVAGTGAGTREPGPEDRAAEAGSDGGGRGGGGGAGTAAGATIPADVVVVLGNRPTPRQNSTSWARALSSDGGCSGSLCLWGEGKGGQTDWKAPWTQKKRRKSPNSSMRKWPCPPDAGDARQPSSADPKRVEITDQTRSVQPKPPLLAARTIWRTLASDAPQPGGPEGRSGCTILCPART